jgi:hypothetical protein
MLGCVPVTRHFAGECGHRVALAARRVEPSLDRLEGEAGRVSRLRVPPWACGELLDTAPEITGVGGGREQRADDREAQACPSHACGRVVTWGHDPPSAAPCVRAAALSDPTPSRNDGLAKSPGVQVGVAPAKIERTKPPSLSSMVSGPLRPMMEANASEAGALDLLLQGGPPDVQVRRFLVHRMAKQLSVPERCVRGGTPATS